MAKGKRFGSIEDPRGVEWQREANEAWQRAVGQAEQLDDPDQTAIDFYEPPDFPDFRADAPEEIEGPILGRFVYHPDDGLVHDVTRATPGCRIEETPRLFIHFAHEIEGAVPPDAEPHADCMG